MLEIPIEMIATGYFYILVSLKEYKNIKINMKLYLMNVEYGTSLLILFNMVRFLSENI